MGMGPSSHGDTAGLRGVHRDITSLFIPNWFYKLLANRTCTLRQVLLPSEWPVMYL